MENIRILPQLWNFDAPKHVASLFPYKCFLEPFSDQFNLEKGELSYSPFSQIIRTACNLNNSNNTHTKWTFCSRPEIWEWCEAFSSFPVLPVFLFFGLYKSRGYGGHINIKLFCWTVGEMLSRFPFSVRSNIICPWDVLLKANPQSETLCLLFRCFAWHPLFLIQLSLKDCHEEKHAGHGCKFNAYSLWGL